MSINVNVYYKSKKELSCIYVRFKKSPSKILFNIIRGNVPTSLYNSFLMHKLRSFKKMLQKKLNITYGYINKQLLLKIQKNAFYSNFFMCVSSTDSIIMV